MDETAAHAAAMTALTDRDREVEVAVRRVGSGWRAWTVGDRNTGIVGASHLLIRADGSTLRCPPGTPDDLAASLIESPDLPGAAGQAPK